MQVAVIGLGKMGGGMARRLTAADHEVVGIDLDPRARQAAEAIGAQTTDSLDALLSLLEAPRMVWVMLKAGEVTRGVIRQLGGLLSPGDIVVDGGNSDFRDAKGHQEALASTGVRFADVGVSGGQWGYQNGYGMTIGASRADFEAIEPVLKSLAAPDGYSRVGDVGSGHLVKAIHNGVQYAVLEAYAEGYALLAAHEDLDVLAALKGWQGGSSIRSWLLDQIVQTLQRNPALTDVSSQVPDSGMGRWTSEEAIRLAVPTPILTAALHARFASRSDGAANRLLSAARGQIGGNS